MTWNYKCRPEKLILRREKLDNKLREMAKSGREISDTANKSLYLLSGAEHSAQWALRRVSYYLIYPNSLKTMHFTVTWVNFIKFSYAMKTFVLYGIFGDDTHRNFSPSVQCNVRIITLWWNYDDYNISSRGKVTKFPSQLRDTECFVSWKNSSSIF